MAKTHSGHAELPPVEPNTPLGHVIELQAIRRTQVDGYAERAVAAQDQYFSDEVGKLSAEAACSEFEAVSGSRSCAGHALSKLISRLTRR